MNTPPTLSNTFNSEYEELNRLPDFLDEMATCFSLSDEVQARLMLVLSEAVTNAILHGNKLDKTKKAVVSAALNEDGSRLLISVEDEGDGFSPDAIPSPLKEENLLKPSGRGVYLMREYADAVQYNETGNRLHIEMAL